MVHLVSICQVAPELESPGDLLTFGLLLGRPGPTSPYRATPLNETPRTHTAGDAAAASMLVPLFLPLLCDVFE